MFVYCNNNPVIFVDVTGYRSVLRPSDMMGGRPYITDQENEAVGSKPLGSSTVAHGGCGAIATYNALLDLGDFTSLQDVLAYYNECPLKRLTLDGWMGVLPNVVAQYFIDHGYRVIMTDDLDAIDIYSATADACIMFYMFTTDSSPLPFGAHFVSYRRSGNKYIAQNAATLSGVDTFTYPSDYGYKNARFYTIGIFIYD